MVELSSKVWRDGDLLDKSECSSVSLLTHTLHYGVGAFEGIRAYQTPGGKTVIFRLREHITRLFASCRVALLEPQVDVDQVCQGCIDLLRSTGMAEAYLRPLCLLAEGAMGLLPHDNPVHTYVMAWRWGSYLGSEGLSNGIRCKVSSYCRNDPRAGFAQAKLVGQYVTSVMAKREAVLAGYDEALMLDVHGFVAEGSGENIFIVKDGALKTPPLSASILPGITRHTVLTLAKEEGFPVQEENFTRDELLVADEVFLTGTAAELTPVREIDDRPINGLSVGRVTKALQQRFFAVVRGTDPRHAAWLTEV